MADTVCNNLFVYGTLVDQDFFKYMFKRKPTEILEGHIMANIYDCGTFPMVIDDEEGKVYGLIYTVVDLETILPSIDKYERFIPDEPDESLFLRKKVVVTSTSNEEIEAWMYVGNPGSKFCKERCVPENVIESGRWKRR